MYYFWLFFLSANFLIDILPSKVQALCQWLSFLNFLTLANNLRLRFPLIYTTFVAWKYWFKLTDFRCFLALYSLVFFLCDLNRTIIRPCALIPWLKNLHSVLGHALTGRPRNAMLLTYLLSHAQHKTTNKPSSFRNTFELLKTYHPVLDERRLKETALIRIWNLPTGQMYLWMRCIIFLYLSLPERRTILSVLKMCEDKQWNHLHKTLTILIPTV